MSRGGSKGNKFLYILLAIFVIGAVAFASAAFVADTGKTKFPVAEPLAPLPAAPASTLSPEPQSVPSSESPQAVFVEEFEPTNLTLEGPDGMILNTPLAGSKGQINGYLEPADPQLPNMLVDPERVTKPGTNQGTVLLIGHSRLNDDGNRFNKLMELPQSVNTGGYTVALDDDAGHTVSYSLEAVLDVEKARFGAEENLYLQDNRPGRLLLVTSWVKGTYPPPEKARIIIGCDAAHPGCSAP